MRFFKKKTFNMRFPIAATATTLTHIIIRLPDELSFKRRHPELIGPGIQTVQDASPPQFGCGIFGIFEYDKICNILLITCAPVRVFFCLSADFFAAELVVVRRGDSHMKHEASDKRILTSLITGSDVTAYFSFVGAGLYICRSSTSIPWTGRNR